MAIARWGRPTIYKQIRMRSRLEARFAALFDRAGIPWKYEPQNFAEEGTGRQYLPDFAFLRPNGTVGTYVEIKPPLNEDEIDAVKDRMQIIWESDPDVRLWLIHIDDDSPLSADGLPIFFTVESGYPGEPPEWGWYSLRNELPAVPA